jgi:hypothetical protein
MVGEGIIQGKYVLRLLSFFARVKSGVNQEEQMVNGIA